MKGIEFEHLLADRGQRLGGALVDGLIAALIYIPLMIALGIFQKEINEEPIELWMQVCQSVGWWAILFLLNGYLLVTRGQSIGKLFVKTRIVNLDENIPSATSIIGKRYVISGAISYIPIVGQIFGLANALFIFRKDKRCLHDHIAGTCVIKAT
jgi:uncharacterized RDD family membrane protein YckC